MPAHEPDARAVSIELNAVHQAAHEKDAEAAAALLDRRVITSAVDRETLAVVADFDGELVLREQASHGKAVGAHRAAVFHRVAERFAGSQPDIADFFGGEAANAREACYSVSRQRNVATVAGECGAVSRTHLRFGYPMERSVNGTGGPFG